MTVPATTANTRDDDAHPEWSFVNYLVGNREGRRKGLVHRDDGDARRRLAELRRSAADTNPQPRALAVVGHLVPDAAHGWALDAYLLTAELVALCAAGGREVTAFDPDTRRDRRSLGASARAVNPRSPNADGDFEDQNKGVGQRFGAVLALPAEDLADELRRLVRLLHHKGAPLDFYALLPDLLRWTDPDQPTQKTWARHYWSAPAPLPTPSPPTP